MNIETLLDQQIQDYLSMLKPPTAVGFDIDTRVLLFEIASMAEWSEESHVRLDLLSKRVEISQRLYLGYQQSWLRATDEELIDRDWLGLAVAIMLKYALFPTLRPSPEIHLKRFNALFKMLDIARPDWLFTGSEIDKGMRAAWEGLFTRLPKQDLNIDAAPPCGTRAQNGLRDIPLTVLFYEGPIARAYLETIYSLGLKPQKIIELVAGKDIATRKPVATWLPRGLRRAYASLIQKSQIHFWPDRLSKTQPSLIKAISECIMHDFGFSEATITASRTRQPLSVYSNSVQSILIDDLKDDTLHRHLANEAKGVVLYTGGGIMPASLLDIPHLKFLHIHPGFLPQIRGADCTLWSTLLTGHASASCFYMSPGIDVGDIIHSSWLPKLELDFSTQNIDPKTLYRAVYSFIDPWVRSFVLRQVLGGHDRDFFDLPAQRQAEADGTTFHFMHDRIKQLALRRIISCHEKVGDST